MNIALVVHDFDPRFGQGRYAVELAGRLGGAHNVRVYANTFGVAPAANVTFQRVPARRGNSLLTVLTFIQAAENLLRARPHDLIHAQGLSCWNADVITAHICNAARYGKVPVTGRARLFPALVCPLEKKFYQQARARQLIAVSRATGAEIKAEYGWQKDCTVIYHGTDTERFRPPTDAAERSQARARYQLEDGPPTWLFAGEATKGLVQVIDQLPAFPNASVLVISRSDPAAFLAQAARAGVGARVRWHGTESEIHHAYRAADLFVYPSAYDAFGLVVAEAMASGLPVIAGKDIGAAEWIAPRENGMLCDPAQPESLRDALQWVQADPARSGKMGQAARRTVEQHGWDACAKATAAVYERALRERKTP